MKNLLILATSALCVLLAVSVPLPAETDQNVQLVQIPLEGNKELDILSLPENAEGQLSERNKRTIGVLRQLFPELSKKVEQMIEESVQLVLPIIFRNVGPLLLRGGLGGLSGGGAATNLNNNDDDDDDDFDDDNSNTSVKEGADGRKVSISLPTFPPDTDDDDDDDDEQSVSTNDGKSGQSGKTDISSSGNNEIDLAALSERLDSINRVVRQTNVQTKQQPATPSASDIPSADTNTIATAISNKADSNGAASEVAQSKSPAIDELTLDDDETKPDDDRNKRFLSFGLGGSGSGSGGSGNFLFDIIRLVGGSAGTEANDERENAPEGEVTVTKSADGYTEGIPGPVTRLIVLANRGIANLIQDLILRIAQTSERVVNFKARLITSLI